MAGLIQIFLPEPGHFHACWLLRNLDRRLKTNITVTARPSFDLNPFIAWYDNLKQSGDQVPDWIVRRAEDPLEPICDYPGPKLAILAGQNHLKADRVARLLSQGVPVVCDKPLWTDPARAKSLISLLKNHPFPIYLDDLMTERLEPTFFLQRELLRQQIPGLELRPASSHRKRFHLGNHHHLVKSIGGLQVRRSREFLDWHHYGDPFADVGVHLVDQWLNCLEAAGESPTLVSEPSVPGFVQSHWADLDPETLNELPPDRADSPHPHAVPYPLSQVWQGQGTYQGVTIESSWGTPNGTPQPEGQFCSIPTELGGMSAMKTDGDPVMCLHLIGLPVTQRPIVSQRIQAALETLPNPWPQSVIEITRYGIKVIPPTSVQIPHPNRFPLLLSGFLDRLDHHQSLTTPARTHLLQKYQITTASPRHDHTPTTTLHPDP